MSRKDNDLRSFYHYTNSAGKDAIVRDMRIAESTNKTTDARFGQGVYGTSKRPTDHSLTSIAKNNYDGAWEHNMGQGKLDYAIKVKLPAERIQEETVTGGAGQRKILLHKGPINLAEQPFTIITPAKK